MTTSPSEIAVDRLQWLADQSPDAWRLARLASPAVRVEPHLLRRLRLELLPDADVGTEADLWFSPVVEAQGVEAIVFDAHTADLLRTDLARETDLLHRALAVIERAHESLPPALRLEERLNGIALIGGAAATAEIGDELRTAIRAMTESTERAGEIARWVMRAWPRLHETVRGTPAAATLALAASTLLRRRMSADPMAANARLTEVSWILPSIEFDRRVDVGVALGDGTLRFVAAGTEADVHVPDTRPPLVELEWRTGDETHVQIVDAVAGRVVDLRGSTGEVRIGTLDGAEYVVTSEAVLTGADSSAEPAWLDVSPFDAVAEACVRVAAADAAAGTAWSTAFYIGPSTIVTARWPLEGRQRIRIEPAARIEAVEIIDANSAADVLVLEPATGFVHSEPVRLATPPIRAAAVESRGELQLEPTRVVILGHDGEVLRAVEGSAWVSDLEGREFAVTLDRSTLPAGFVGGPVVADNRVRGLVVSIEIREAPADSPDAGDSVVCHVAGARAIVDAYEGLRKRRASRRAAETESDSARQGPTEIDRPESAEFAQQKASGFPPPNAPDSVEAPDVRSPSRSDPETQDDTQPTTKHVSLPLRLIEPSIYAAALDLGRYTERPPQMYLAVASPVGPDMTARLVRELVRVSAPDLIHRVVREAAPGLGLRHAADPPGTLQTRPDYQYFGLESSGANWEAIEAAREVAVYVPSALPDPKLELIVLVAGDSAEADAPAQSIREAAQRSAPPPRDAGGPRFARVVVAGDRSAGMAELIRMLANPETAQRIDERCTLAWIERRAQGTGVSSSAMPRGSVSRPACLVFWECTPDPRWPIAIDLENAALALIVAGPGEGATDSVAALHRRIDNASPALPVLDVTGPARPDINAIRASIIERIDWGAQPQVEPRAFEAARSMAARTLSGRPPIEGGTTLRPGDPAAGWHRELTPLTGERRVADGIVIRDPALFESLVLAILEIADKRFNNVPAAPIDEVVRRWPDLVSRWKQLSGYEADPVNVVRGVIAELERMRLAVAVTAGNTDVVAIPSLMSGFVSRPDSGAMRILSANWTGDGREVFVRLVVQRAGEQGGVRELAWDGASNVGAAILVSPDLFIQAEQSGATARLTILTQDLESRRESPRIADELRRQVESLLRGNASLSFEEGEGSAYMA